MGNNLLFGKKGIIFGALNDRSIAWKAAEKVADEGGSIVLTNTPLAVRMGDTTSLAERVNAPVIPADATDLNDLENLVDQAMKYFGGRFDFVLHAVGMSMNIRKSKKYEEADYQFFSKTLDISAMSFHKLMNVLYRKDALNEYGSVVALSYLAADKAVDGYNDMADAKAMLQSVARNFGLVYGMSEFSLAAQTGMTRGEAKEYIDTYLDKYHGVRDYMKKIVEQAKADGCGTFRHEDGQGWQDYLWDRHRFSWQDRFLMADRVLKTGRNEIRLTDDGVVIKSFAVPRGWKRLLYTWLRASKACRSYRIAQRLGDRTPQPLGYQELHRHGWLSHSYYACRLSDCPYTFKDLRQPDFLDRERHLRAIARFTARLHEEGILHTDYSQGNILFNEADRIQLVDLNRIRFLRRIGINKGIRNFSRLHLGDDYAYGIMIDEYKRARNTKI